MSLFLSMGDKLAFDRATARRFDVDGRMHVQNCRISKANVCPYLGREIPDYASLGLDANRVYMLYRPAEELEKAAPTFRNAQLLMRHAPVNATDPKTHVTIGTVGSGISFDGTYLVSDQLTVWSQDGIDLIESKEAAELSSGYHFQVSMIPGRAPNGDAYDGSMHSIVGNHVALARRGRVGPDVFVNDAYPILEPKTMKRPHLLARLVTLGCVTNPATDEARLALDEKLAEITAKDTHYEVDEEMEDDPENPGKKRKKGKAPGAPIATDAMIDAAIRAKGYVTSTEAQAMALDAAGKAANDAVARVNALHAAREMVKPLVGVVAFDSADAVYRFALEKEGVALDGVHASAFPALVAQRVAMKTVTPISKVPFIGADAATAAAAALPGLGRIQVAS